MQVLIVSGNQETRGRLRQALARFGCEPLEAGTLHEAVDLLGASPVGLILSEPALPGTSAHEIVARFRTTSGGRDARIVAVGVGRSVSQDLATAGFDDGLHEADRRSLELLVAAARREFPARLEASQERARSETVRRLSLDLAWSTSIEQQARHALDAVRKTLPVHGAAIWLRDRQEGDVACAQATGLSPSYEIRAGALFKVMSGRQWLALTRAPEVIPDARVIPSPLAALAEAEGFTGTVQLALFTPTQVLGALAVYIDDPGALAPDRLEMLQMIAAATAMAIDQTQLRGRLNVAESRLRAVLEQVPDGVFIQDAQGNFLMTNRAMSTISGYAPEELELLNIDDLVDLPAGRAIRERVKGLLGGDDTLSGALEVPFIRPDERQVQVELFFSLLPPDDLTGQFALQGIVRDVDAIARARRELDTHEAIARIVADGRDFDAALAGIVGALQNHMHYERGGIWTLGPSGDTFHPRARFGGANGSAAARLREAARTGASTWEAIGEASDEGSAICVPIISVSRLIGVLDVEADERRPLLERDRVFLESLAAHIAGSLERARLHDELARQAVTDPVTGLPNRNRFRTELEAIIAAGDGRPVSLLIAGVDGFKALNDTYGDAVADDILRQVGQVLAARVPASGFLARHNGDSFVVLLPGTGRDEAVQVGENLRIAVAMQLFTAADQVEQLTTSIGAATWPDEATGPADLVAAAAHALYLAKQAGRNQVFQSNAALAALAPAHGRIRDMLRQSPSETLTLLVQAMDQRLQGRTGHAERVAAYSSEIARQLGVPEREIDDLRVAAHVHDIGMLTLPDSLLRKPGRLSAAERELLRGVPRAAYGMLVQLNLPEVVLQSVVHQHEHWDGSGYPSGLGGDDIPLGARIIAVADALDAMTSARAHREPMTMAEALQEIEGEAGKQFDPEVVGAAAALTDLDPAALEHHDLAASGISAAEVVYMR